MSELIFNLKHDGGNHRVEIESQGDTAVIRFGPSFTLRLDEENLNNLQMHLASAVREMCIERRDTSDVYDREINAESEMIQAGINAREKLKQKKQQTFNPNDPVNW
jgi:hypothetical protein